MFLFTLTPPELRAFSLTPEFKEQRNATVLYVFGLRRRQRSGAIQFHRDVTGVFWRLSTGVGAATGAPPVFSSRAVEETFTLPRL
jgi:hypothetical protein